MPRPVSLAGVKREIDTATDKLRVYAKGNNNAVDARKLALKIRDLEALGARVDKLCKRVLECWPVPKKG